MDDISKFIDVTGRGDALPRDDNLGDYFAIFEDTVNEVPRDEWQDRINDLPDLANLVYKIRDQGREGSCTSNATSCAYEVVFNSQFGKARCIEVSAISLYKRCGSSPGSGSTVSGNMRELKDRGILPLSTTENQNRFKHTMPATGFYTPFPSGWEETAKLFRATEWFDIASFGGFVSALLLGWPVVYGRAGHAICGIRPVNRDGKWLIKYANSWKPSWGDNGYGYDSESFLSGSIRSYGAYALRAVKVQPEFFK